MDVAATPAEVISGVIYESDECPDIFEKEAFELAGGIIEALAEAGFDITSTAKVASPEVAANESRCSYCYNPAPYVRVERNPMALGGMSDYPVCGDHRDGPMPI